MAENTGNSGITFSLTPDGRKILATCSPGAFHSGTDAEAVHRLLEAQGFGEYFISETAVGLFIKKCGVAACSVTMEIGERRDGALVLKISPDYMEARITITPPFGGDPVSKEQVARALQEERVVSGILHDEIERAIQETKATDLLIATGRPAEQGSDSQFVSLIPEMRERCPFADQDNHVDYRNMGGVVSVNPGDPLLRRVPPTKGIPGENVLGTELPAEDGVEVAFAPNLTGTAPTPDDPDLLVAAIAGLPVLVDRGVIVEPVLNMKNVDLSSGNLHFTGTINISGDVKEGMEVTATGDIVIGGVVEGAKLDAGGDIEIKGGVIGQTEVRNSKGEMNADIASIHAAGSVTAKFAENACIVAGRDVNIQEVAMKSDITSGNTVTVGEKGMRKGHIIGGVCRATTLVHAIVVGSPANVVTRIEVGVDPAVHEKLWAVKQQLEDKEKRQEEIDKTLAYIRDNSAKVDPGLAALKERAHTLLQAEIVELRSRKKRLQKQLELVQNARIEVEKTVFFGTQLMVGDKQLVVEDDLEGKTFCMGEDGIVY